MTQLPTDQNKNLERGRGTLFTIKCHTVEHIFAQNNRSSNLIAPLNHSNKIYFVLLSTYDLNVLSIFTQTLPYEIKICIEAFNDFLPEKKKKNSLIQK